MVDCCPRQAPGSRKTDVLARPITGPRAPKPAPTVDPDAATRADIDKFDRMLERYLAGRWTRTSSGSSA